MSPRDVRNGHLRRATRAFAIAALALSPWLAGDAMAQATGTVTGTVRDATNGQPIAGAQVSIPSLNLGALANNVGRYLLLNVPAGTHTVQVQYIGYGTETMEVTVAGGQTVTADFRLRSEAISLEGVVVTGTAGAARRREIGNSITQINQSAIEAAPIDDVGDILQGRAVGVTVLDNSGQVGAGNTIRLRGNNSVTQGNSPLIYVDGVRIRNTAYPGDPENNQAPSPLNDINPNDIERVEVIKGAAATTLYGTEAAGGVIQIFTKRGTSGAAAWSLSVDQGINNLGHIGPDASINPTGLGLNKCNSNEDPMFPADPSCPESGSWLKNGYIQKYNLSVRGGAERLNYFMSASWGNERGVFDTGKDPETGEPRKDQGQKSWSLRGNFSFSPIEELDIRFNSFYSHKNIDWVPDGNNAEGLLLNVFRGGKDYTNDVDGKVLDMKLNNLVDHFVTGVNLLYNPGMGMTHRLNAGLDWSRATYYEERPWGFFYRPLGNREVDDFITRKLTLDYAGTWEKDFMGVASSFSWGGQLYNDFVSGINGFGNDFAGPGDKVLESGARTEAFEYNSRVTSGGFFFQEQLGFKDRIFVTAGLRVDGHSAFGKDFGLQPYPKASISYIISDESWFPENFGTLKLRSAIGESGKAPGTFDAVRTWESVSGDEGQPAVTPDNLGNPDLGPEKTREFEFGFEGSTLNDRVTFEYTYYNQKTFDALIAVRQLPSAGFVGTQLENVGEVRNKGHEAFLNITPVASDFVTWDVGLRLATNNSEVIDLGGLESINLGWRNYVRAPKYDPGYDGPLTFRNDTVYYPLPVFCHDRVQNPDEVGKPQYAEECLGPTTPTKTYGINTSITLGERLTIDVLGEGQGGHVLSSGTAYQNTRRSVWPLCRETFDAIAAGNRDQLTAGERALCDPGQTRYGMWTQKADFFKIRSASISYRVPDDWLPGSIRAATVRLQGRNLATFTDYQGIDPEAFEDGSREVLFRQEYYNLPPIRSFIFSVKVDF
ncbi:MAG: TonB-dependent receptor domain-containing protein [Gemmatimonadota bacterium]